MESNEGLPGKTEGSGNPRQPRGSLRTVLKHSDMLLMALGTIGFDILYASVDTPLNLKTKTSKTALISFTLQYALALLYVAVGIGSGAFLGPDTSSKINVLLLPHEMYQLFKDSVGHALQKGKTSQLRTRYLQAVLRQKIGFFDTIHGASMTSQGVSADTLVIHGVLSEKVFQLIILK
ncbi:unnamed protein product [Ilex paraguariensis]|uniref:ABC transmembrane type-1 domain-containing protein n=1 Tax=Ilex paraguariensis TaxID=185542 RepID=A0ABC8QYU3_9AQUA